MAEKMVVAVPRLHHGLGNRVRVVLSAQDLAASTGRAFAYVWPTGKPFGARFDELWQSDLRRISSFRSTVMAVRHPYRDAGDDWRDAATRDPIWQIRTSQPIVVDGSIETWHDRLRALRPTHQIAAEIHAMFDDGLRGAPYLGVMVRSHAVSHEITRRESPFEWYLDRISDIRRANPGIGLFVSADTAEAHDRVLAAFPNVRSVRDKGAYNSGPALRAAVADLYLLAASTHIVGPHYSSFPELAKFLAGPSVSLETSASAPGSRFEQLSRQTIVEDPTRPSARTPA